MYYARTRRQPIEAMVHRLADMGGGSEWGSADAGPQAAAEAAGAAAPAAEMLAGLLDRLAARADDHRVRWALTADLGGRREGAGEPVPKPEPAGVARAAAGEHAQSPDQPKG